VRLRLRLLLEEALAVEIVGETGSASEAVMLAKLHRPDAVLLDLQLADGDGCWVTEQVKHDHPDCGVVMFTQFAADAFRYWARDAGVDHFLDKSREFERIPALLQELAARPRTDGSPE
jgi:DNA-binding NarL/FixJ family response regulator